MGEGCIECKTQNGEVLGIVAVCTQLSLSIRQHHTHTQLTLPSKARIVSGDVMLAILRRISGLYIHYTAAADAFSIAIIKSVYYN